jgi:hypothetical protein
MGVIKADIIAKAKLCVDETLDSSTFKSSYLPIEEFVDEAVRWVIDSVPIKALGNGSTNQITTATNGVATLNSVDGRFLWAKGGGWDRVVSSFIYDDNPRCAQLKDPIFGARSSRPTVVISYGGRTIELHGVEGGSSVGIMPYQSSSDVWDFLPAEFLDIIAWRTAELTLSAISDVNGAAVCANKVVEHLESFQR